MRFEGEEGVGGGTLGGHQGGLGVLVSSNKQNTSKEIVKSVDLNSKNEQIALTERGVTFH